MMQLIWLDSGFVASRRPGMTERLPSLLLILAGFCEFDLDPQFDLRQHGVETRIAG